ncbi:hydrophobin 2 [Mycena albidolilacea]|uniref:Hydrophobin n=1 Tax=Mycena albidolilacea TaxID=1033008 RepID=A0AAD6Z1V9_9AGAR|nr:hydrophobin 2 [Mycena albidolilacea]
MVFYKLSVALTSVFIALAAADTIPGYSVPTSPQCCNELTSSSTPAASAIAHFVLGLDITGLLIDVGLSCSPITVVGNNCGGTVLKCSAPELAWGGVIALNCIPFTLA